MKKILLIVFLISAFKVQGQSDSLKNPIIYSFIIQDTPSQLFTMKQVNQGYLSGYRLFARGLYAAFENDLIADMIQLGIEALFFMPLTHEEGHRSILTVNNIGSISQPYFNKYGAAYVKGVTDQTLQDLRDTDLPTYIRLHSGGLESDYMLTRRMETIGSFELDEFKNYKWEYWLRKLAILQYYVMGLFKYDIDLEEETNELERDIVGMDTYGAARHLYRPTMDFHRYTSYGELSGEEREFIQRLGYRSLLNLLNPLMIGRGTFQLTESLGINAGMGYTMSPFGDFIDENIRLKYKSLNLSIYARQFQNRENWFKGFGVSLVNLQAHHRILTSLSAHYWQQPVDFNFNTSESFSGGAVDVDLKYFFLNNQRSWLRGLSVDFGIIYKTRGFLPEDLFLDEHVGLRIGTSIRI